MLQHKRTWSVIASLVALALVMLACGGGGNSGSADNGSSSPAASSQHFKVGQQVKVGDTFDVTVNSVTKNAGSDLDQPGSGNVYLIVDVTLKNISSAEQDVSSLVQFTLQDATGQKYDETITTFTTPPDGKVEAGALLRGKIAYPVPSAQHKFTLAFEADITSTGQTTWDLSI